MLKRWEGGSRDRRVGLTDDECYNREQQARDALHERDDRHEQRVALFVLIALNDLGRAAGFRHGARGRA